MADTLREICDDLAINIRGLDGFTKAGGYLMDNLICEEFWAEITAAREQEFKEIRRRQLSDNS